MSLLEALGIAGAGLWAGMINVVVGSGSLVTFPVLIFFGYPPVAANISNGVGLVAGGLAGSWGYRRELRDSAYYAKRMIGLTVIGALAGALLLLVLPEEAFEMIVPALIALALVLVVAGPRLNAWVRDRAARKAEATGRALDTDRVGVGGWIALIIGTLFAGMYGGYFGAAQGVLLFGIMSLIIPLGAQRLNGLKNLLVTAANLVSAAVFIVMATDQVNWAVVGLIALGSFLGGLLGAKIGRRLPPWALRATIVVVGVIALAVLLW